MAVDWDNFDNEIDGIIEDAAIKTDEALASKISSLTKMTDAEEKELFPESSDAKKLISLMKIVKSSEDQNVKINKIVSNSKEFGKIMLTIADKLV